MQESVTYEGVYLTWEVIEERSPGVRRPVDGWASWVMSNLWRALAPLLLGSVCWLGVMFLLASSVSPGWLLWVTRHLEGLLGLGLGLSLCGWLWLMRNHPFLDSPRPSAQDRRWWRRVSRFLPSSAREAAPQVSRCQRWIEVPVSLSLVQSEGALRLSWSAEYPKARRVEAPLEGARVDGSRPPPRLEGGVLELRPGGFALELLRAPTPREPLTVELRSTRRPRRLALTLGALSPEDIALPVLERARVWLPLSSRAALLRRLLQHAQECGHDDAPRLGARVIATFESN
jgi:hypothetical protein